MANKQSSGFDWGGLFNLIGVGANAGANIHAATQDRYKAELYADAQKDVSRNQKFGMILSSLVDAQKAQPFKIMSIFVGISILLFILLYFFKK